MICTLSELAIDHFLTQFINEPTHKDGNILDILLTNKNSIIHAHECHEVPRSTTHHRAIEVMTSLTTVIQTITTTIDPSSIPPLKTLNFFSDSVDWSALQKDISSVDWTQELEQLSPEERVDKILSICFTKSEKHIPKSKDPCKPQAIPRERRATMRRRFKINKRLLHLTSPKMREKLRSELISIEVELQQSRKKSKLHQEQKAINSIKKNSKYFFSYAKKFAKTTSTIGPLKDRNGNFIYDNLGIANLLADQYMSVFNKPTINCPDKQMLFPDLSDMPFGNINFTEKDFIEAIDELSSTAGAGPDGLPAILLKQCKEQIAPALTILWRDSLDIGIVPTNLKEPIIFPLYKGGIKTEAVNYRPIAFTSYLIKVFEKVIHKRLVEYLEETDQFNDNQHGFRKE